MPRESYPSILRPLVHLCRCRRTIHTLSIAPAARRAVAAVAAVAISHRRTLAQLRGPSGGPVSTFPSLIRF